jgi:hypothetical protein
MTTGGISKAQLSMTGASSADEVAHAGRLSVPACPHLGARSTGDSWVLDRSRVEPLSRDPTRRSGHNTVL